MKIKKTGKAVFLFIILPAFLAGAAYAATPDEARLKLAVFPFSNMEQEKLDTRIPSVLTAELLKFDFIEIVPVEMVTKRLYEIVPSLMWTEKKGDEKRGGIIWTIQTDVMEEVRRNVSADFSVYGSLAGFGEKWRLDVHVMEDGDGSGQLFTVSGIKDEEMPDKISEAAHMIADFLKGKSAVRAAEHYIRSYMGGMYSYEACLVKIGELARSFPGSVPLHALLLDLYLRKKAEYSDEALRESLKIMEMYKPENGVDTRYLLSLNIDPFDAAAGIYEDREDWENAISIRSRALTDFPYRTTLHKNALGKDYYQSGVSLESSGHAARALERYEKALVYLKQPSEYIGKADERINKLKHDQQHGEEKR